MVKARRIFGIVNVKRKSSKEKLPELSSGLLLIVPLIADQSYPKYTQSNARTPARMRRRKRVREGQRDR